MPTIANTQTPGTADLHSTPDTTTSPGEQVVTLLRIVRSHQQATERILNRAYGLLSSPNQR